MSYQFLSNNYAKLESEGLLEAFKAWLNLVVQSNSEEPTAFANNLKLIVNDLIDKAFTKPKRKASKNISLSISSNNLVTKRRQQSTKNEDFSSEFDFIPGHATFDRQVRPLNKKIDLSPGPSDYSPSEKQRSKSPRIVFNKAGKRFENARIGGPGPGRYNPRQHFLSKY